MRKPAARCRVPPFGHETAASKIPISRTTSPFRRRIAKPLNANATGAGDLLRLLCHGWVRGRLAHYVGWKKAIAAANALGARPDRPNGDARSRAGVAQIVGK